MRKVLHLQPRKDENLLFGVNYRPFSQKTFSHVTVRKIQVHIIKLIMAELHSSASLMLQLTPMLMTGKNVCCDKGLLHFVLFGKKKESILSLI